MKIESTIRRKNGTRVQLDDNLYHFKPTADDERHLCDVEVKAHIQRFLSIPEGFQPAELSDVFQPASGENDKPVLGTLAGVVNRDGTTSTISQLPRDQLLVLARDMEIENAESLSDEELVTAIQAEPVEPVEDGEGEDANKQPDTTAEKTAEKPADKPAVKDTAAALDRDKLAAEYQAKFGKKPHHNLSAARIKQILDEDAE